MSNFAEHMGDGDDYIKWLNAEMKDKEVVVVFGSAPHPSGQGAVEMGSSGTFLWAFRGGIVYGASRNNKQSTEFLQWKEFQKLVFVSPIATKVSTGIIT